MVGIKVAADGIFKDEWIYTSNTTFIDNYYDGQRDVTVYYDPDDPNDYMLEGERDI